MQDFEYTITIKPTVTNGTLDTARYEGFSLKAPVPINITTFSDGSCKVTAPALKTFATGQTHEEAFRNLVDEIMFLESNEVSLCA